MQEHKKIYPSGRAPAKWLSWLLVAAAVLVAAGGLISRSPADPFIQPLPTATPFPLEESFDETVESCQWTLPEVNWYALQLGAFDSEASAQELAEQFRARGAAGYLWQDGRWRVLAAVYATEEDARTVRKQISDTHGVDSYLFHISLPGAGVSMQGMRGQIEILKAAFEHAAALVADLQQLSLQADHTQNGAEELQAALLALRDQTALVSIRLQQRFPQPRNACAEGLINLFESYAVFYGALEEDEMSVAFGAALKHQTILSLDLLRQVYHTLGNT